MTRKPFRFFFPFLLWPYFHFSKRLWKPKPIEGRLTNKDKSFCHLSLSLSLSALSRRSKRTCFARTSDPKLPIIPRREQDKFLFTPRRMHRVEQQRKRIIRTRTGIEFIDPKSVHHRSAPNWFLDRCFFFLIVCLNHILPWPTPLPMLPL